MFENADFDDNLLLCIDKVAKPLTTKRPSESTKKGAGAKKSKTFDAARRIGERKFPGPAGLLPEHSELSHDVTIREIPCSQTTLSLFRSNSWFRMISDCESLVEKYDIDWIKANASVNKLHNRKAPFLAATIKNLECFDGKHSIVKVVLKDMSGEIQAAVIRSLYEEYSDGLVVGSTVVLRQFSVLTTGTGANHYLTITHKNLISIYTNKGVRVEVVGMQSVADESRNERHVRKLPTEAQNETVKSNLSEEDLSMWKDAVEGLDFDSIFGEFN